MELIVDALNVSSAHLTFNLEDESKLLEEEGYLGNLLQSTCKKSAFTKLLIGRVGLQYHWYNHDYSTFDEFLMDLKQSKRKNIRQVTSCSRQSRNR